MDPFPDDVRRFLHGHVETVDQLDYLRVLCERPDEVWEVGALAQAAEADPATAAAQLAALHARGLVAIERQGPAARYRYGPSTPEVAAVVARAVHLYRERPVSTIKVIYARPKGALRSFADAFRLRDGG